MCVYGHFNTRASNGTEPLFQQCSSSMSDSSVSFADMYGRSVFCGQDSASHPVHAHIEFIVDFEHRFYVLLRISDFVPK